PLFLALFPLLAAFFLHGIFLLALLRGQHAIDTRLSVFAQGFHLAAVIIKDAADFLALRIVEFQLLGNTLHMFCHHVVAIPMAAIASQGAQGQYKQQWDKDLLHRRTPSVPEVDAASVVTKYANIRDASGILCARVLRLDVQPVTGTVDRIDKAYRRKGV